MELEQLLARRTQFSQPGEKQAMLDLAAAQRAAHPGEVISLGRGDPDMSTPPEIIAAGVRALQAGQTGYTQWPGLPELRSAIAEWYRAERGVPVEPDEVLVTVGAQESVFLTMMSFVGPGDEVIMPEPRYMPYDIAVNMAGGKPVSLATRAEDGFHPDPQALQAAITERTKALLLVSPNNPTGGVIPKERLDAIGEVVRDRQLVVISDELYGKLVYGGAVAHSFAAVRGMRERTVIINGFSKGYSMTGWRIGYLIASKPVVRIMTEMKSATTICAPNFAQRAALAALREGEAASQAIVSEYDKRRRYVMGRLDALGMEYTPPDGAFYVFASIEKVAAGRSSFEFAKELLSAKQVLIFPGTIFGPSGEGYVRISLLAPVEKLQEAFDRLEAFVKHS